MKQYIFVMSHMRSYSSLLCHILGSHEEIDGYGESHISYKDSNSLERLENRIERMLNAPLRGRYLLDKLLHNRLVVNENIFSERNAHFFFLVREPEAAMRSILFMGSNLVKWEWHQDPERVRDYYIERLEYLSLLATKLSTYPNVRVNFINAESLISETVKVLTQVTRALGLEHSLTPHYCIFPFTGMPGYGDPSDYIRNGHIVSHRNTYDEIILAAENVERAKVAYLECKKRMNACCYLV